jgi:membrane protease YdiL (CAAX protease family)
MGVSFGVPAGLLEAVGWTGFAFPRMSSRHNSLAASILIGTATPHGPYWFPFFLVFAFAMTAMRVLISWLNNNTNSVPIAQLMHISSIGLAGSFSALPLPPPARK